MNDATCDLRCLFCSSPDAGDCCDEQRAMMKRANAGYNSLTPADLDTIEARANAATPGPWLTTEQAPKWDTPTQCGYDSREHHRGPPYFATGVCVETIAQAEADSTFIAHARTDVPRLLATARTAHQDRAAVRALIDALPKCEGDDCAVTATRCVWGDGATHFCDDHALLVAPGVARDHRYAAPLRTLLAQMATWPAAGEPAPQAPLSPAAARAEADRLREIAGEAQDDYMRAECHARALESGRR